MSQHFTHLHLHTDYSLLDGAITLERLVQFGKEQQLKALAITDHGNVFGAVKFFQLAKKANIKPILGIEAYFTDDVTQKNVEKKYHHLILLVQNKQGYQNLCKLLSFAYQQGFYFKPRIDYGILEKHSEGLIATTACLGGHIPSLLMQGNDTEAEKRMDWFMQVFGKDRFYFEVQPEDQHDQKVLNAKLFEWSARKDIPLIASADCHYVNAEDREAHEVMLAVQTQSKMTDPDRFTFGDCRAYMRTQTEMLEIFKDHEQAVWNSGKIADMCDFQFETGKLFFPEFEIPQEHTQESFFKHLCEVGFEDLLNQERIDRANYDFYRARLDEEVNLITKMGFIGYFLVVSDFIQWAKRNKIPVGPGRGSAAGSLVAWALQITNIDPIKYNLLFERFLNPERITMPDIDIDFCIEGRDKVINYVRDHYGHEKVGQIITFGTMLAKGVVKDVARALGIPFDDANAITNLIPEQLKITLKEAFDQEPRLKEMVDANPRAAKLFEIAFKLEGLTRHASKHAAGIVISPAPIDEVLPVYVPPKSTELVTQFAMTELESIGFLKIDFLGLKNLTLIDRAVKLIEKNHGVLLDIDKLPLDDAKTFQLLGQGKTSGVFQLESDGLKDVLIKLQPDKFEDVIAVNALYRPGPLGSGMVDDYIQRRHGKQEIKYLFPELAPILEETYGVIVYQEQVMKIASAIGSYSLGEADILRRAMGKKKPEEMAKQRQIFLDRAIQKGFDGQKAGELFDLMAYFAGYGFNKSHSAAYALIAYQTAFLKAHYRAEFMACLISLESDHPEKMSFYLQEAKDLGLPILPPHVNQSQIDFDVVNGAILFGLRGIKNVGMAALETILVEREKKPFADLLDFCSRVDLRTVNKRVIENLICAGGFDALPGNRAQKTEELETIIERALALKKSRLTGQMGLFDIGAPKTDDADAEIPAYQFAPRADWENKQKLEKEREVIGFYLSAHPLDSYKKYTSLFTCSTFEELRAVATNLAPADMHVATACGLKLSAKQIVTKKGDRMAFLQLEDATGKAEIVVFPSVFKKVEQWLDTHQVFLVKGIIDPSSMNQCKIKANEIVPVDLFFEQWPVERATIKLPTVLDNELLSKLKAQLTPGSVPLYLQFDENNKLLQLKTNQTITLNAATVEFLQSLAAEVKLIV
ncbi:DNA polymerase III subunit alpha [Candidatus Dependentiae bacterium]|nr:DNA polymerase III subunit alpha [Candidatus Dependentiae bacterium]